MTAFVAGDPDFAARVAASFARQALMGTPGATVAGRAGEVEIALASSPAILQQHGSFMAARSRHRRFRRGRRLPHADAGRGVLTVEFKISLLAPGQGAPARDRPRDPARPDARRRASRGARREGQAVALLTATMMAIEGRDGLVD